MSPLQPLQASSLALAALTSVIASLTACGPPSDTGQFCTMDSDCDEVCNRLQECQNEADLISVRVHWTVGGVSPSPANADVCGRIDAFEVLLESDSQREEPVAYFPVPCSLGQVYYDRMPRRLLTVQLTSVSADQNALQSEIRRLDQVDNDLTINFFP